MIEEHRWIFLFIAMAPPIEEGFTVDQLPDCSRRGTAGLGRHGGSLGSDDHVLLDIFHFHPLTVEDCRANRHHPKVEEFPDYIYFIVHAVRRTAARSLQYHRAGWFSGTQTTVTYHHEGFPSIAKVKQAVRASPVTSQRGTAFLLHQIIDGIVDDYLPVMDDFDERINALEDDIFGFARANQQILEEILGLKRSVLRLKRISSKQLEVLYRMSHGQFPQISGSVLPFYRDIYDHLVRVSDLAESYRDLISGSLEAYLSVVSNRLNEIMKVLTIFSAVMLPLTFIAGVYGMNFDKMPELHWRYGYLVAWGIMLVVASVMLVFFWRRGWIGGGKSDRKKDETSSSRASF